MTVVVTGFEPFAGMDHNPSAAVLNALPDRIAGHELLRFVLPVDSAQLGRRLAALPLDGAVALVHLGLALDRSAISIERVALNLLDFALPDNAGLHLQERPIIEGGPLAIATRLPVRPILDAWRSARIPGAASTSAGTFLCNQCLYLSLTHVPERVRVGFVHLAPDETLALSLRCAHQPLPVQAEAIRIALEVTLAA